MSGAPLRLLGIDPGLSGALALVEWDVLAKRPVFADVLDMPVVVQQRPGGRTKTILNVAQLGHLVKHLAADMAWLERVGVRPGEGAVGAFTFGLNYGAIQGVLAAHGAPTHLVTPPTWRGRLGLPTGADKSASLDRARELFPELATKLARKRDDGRAEALLIAWFGATAGQA